LKINNLQTMKTDRPVGTCAKPLILQGLAAILDVQSKHGPLSRTGKQEKRAMEMRKQDWNEVAESINAAVKAVGEEFGLNFDRARWSYNPRECRFTLNASIQKLNGKTYDAGHEEWNRECFFLNLKESDFGREFAVNGNRYKITGVNRRSRKYPVLATQTRTGKVYQWSAAQVKDALKQTRTTRGKISTK
jgi:hypothetical protein